MIVLSYDQSIDIGLYLFFLLIYIFFGHYSFLLF